MPILFHNRADAGRQLAGQLREYAGQDVVVLALPRGGVPVAAEVARALGAPLDVLVVRKLGVPFDPELAMGAIASGGAMVRAQAVIDWHSVSEQAFDHVLQREQQELERREVRYRGGRPPANVQGRTTIVVDDGLATGATMHAAIMALRARQPARIVVAVPVASAGAAEAFASEVDDFVCVDVPAKLEGISLFYADFRQTEDEEVLALLAEFNQPGSTTGG